MLYILLRNCREEIVNTTVNKVPSAGANLLQQWKIESNDKNNAGKNTKLLNSPTSKWGTIS